MIDEKIKFNPDQPIKTFNDDKLGRTDFARNIADHILKWRERDSLVLGLTGPWGSGKSSIKNMVIEHFHGHEHIETIEFNPWEWSSSEKANKAFLKNWEKYSNEKM